MFRDLILSFFIILSHARQYATAIKIITYIEKATDEKLSNFQIFAIKTLDNKANYAYSFHAIKNLTWFTHR